MNSCELQAVLVSSDPVVVDSVSASLEKLGITPSVYEEASAAMRTLSNQKTDAFLVDRELAVQGGGLGHVSDAAARHDRAGRRPEDRDRAAVGLHQPGQGPDERRLA